MAELPSDVIALGELALAFGRVPRITYHPDGVTPESDTDHTVMLSLIACGLAARLGLDVGEVAQLALIHDLVEVYAGDTATLRQPSTQDTEAKRRREHESFDRIRLRFGQAFPWLVEALQRYERQDTREARFVRGLDKCVVKITHLLNGCVTVRGQGMTPAELRQRYAHQRTVEMAYAADLPLVLELHAALADAEVDIYEQICARDPVAAGDALAAAYDRGVQDTLGAAQETINDHAQRLAQVHIAVRRALEAVPRTGPVEEALAELDRWQTDMMAASQVTG